MSTLEALRMNIRAMRCAGNHPFVRRGRGGILHGASPRPAAGLHDYYRIIDSDFRNLTT